MPDKPKTWAEKHPRWAFLAAVSSCLVGVGLLVFSFTIATSDEDDPWARCTEVVKTTVPALVPSVSSANPTVGPPSTPDLETTTRTCEASGLTGAAIFPAVAGFLLLLPLVRLLATDLKLTVGPVSLEGPQKSTADELTETQASSLAVWSSPEQALLTALLTRVDNLGEAVEAISKRRRRF